MIGGCLPLGKRNTSMWAESSWDYDGNTLQGAWVPSQMTQLSSTQQRLQQRQLRRPRHQQSSSTWWGIPLQTHRPDSSNGIHHGRPRAEQEEGLASEWIRRQSSPTYCAAGSFRPPPKSAKPFHQLRPRAPRDILRLPVGPPVAPIAPSDLVARTPLEGIAPAQDRNNKLSWGGHRPEGPPI